MATRSQQSQHQEDSRNLLSNDPHHQTPAHPSNAHRHPASKRLDATGIVFYGLLLFWLLSIVAKMRLEGRRDLWPVLAGSVFFQIVNWAIESPLKKELSLIPQLPRDSIALFTNTAVSLVHSSTVSLSVVALFVTEWNRKGLVTMLMHDELFAGLWPGSHTVLCFSCGYFAYDQWDMLWKHLYSPWAPSLLVHHAVLLTCFTMALYRNVTVNYLILTLFCELHSIFLHLRRVLRMAGLRQEAGMLIILEWSFNWLTFFTSRIFMHVFITIKLLQDASKFPSGIEWPLALAGMIGLHVLNFILGLDLYKAYKKERTRWNGGHKERED